jgi:hypothetical protein
MGRRAAALAALAVMTIAGCGTTKSMGGASGSGAPEGASAVASASPLPRNAVVVPATLSEATQVWYRSASRQASYELLVQRRCPACEYDSSSATVKGGAVELEEGSTPGLPTTVEALFAYVERAQSRQGDVQVVYDRQGVPLWIRVDPDPDVADDEIVVAATFTGRRADLLPAGDSQWTREPETGLRGAPHHRSAWIGTDDRLYVVLGGSGSCPPVPGRLSPIVTTGATAPTMVLVDDTVRPGAGDDELSGEDALCTMDLKPYLFSAAVPEIDWEAASDLPLVMFESGEAERVMSWVAMPWL